MAKNHGQKLSSLCRPVQVNEHNLFLLMYGATRLRIQEWTVITQLQSQLTALQDAKTQRVLDVTQEKHARALGVMDDVAKGLKEDQAGRTVRSRG